MFPKPNVIVVMPGLKESKPTNPNSRVNPKLNTPDDDSYKIETQLQVAKSSQYNVSIQAKYR